MSMAILSFKITSLSLTVYWHIQMLGSGSLDTVLHCTELSSYNMP